MEDWEWRDLLFCPTCDNPNTDKRIFVHGDTMDLSEYDPLRGRAPLKLQNDGAKWSKICLKCGKVYPLTEKAKQMTLLSDAFKDNNKTSKEIDDYIENKLKEALKKGSSEAR